MPRPFRPSGLTVALTAAACCAALGPAALDTALAAAAGTLYEAAPFVLVAEALPAGRLRDLATALGCGCGANVPGALSPIAIALCWLTFGPAVTLARSIAGLAILACRRRAQSHVAHDSARSPFDAFAELLALAPWAAAASVLAGVLSNVGPTLRTPVGLAAAVLAGLALGYVAPCATAAVAIAAALVGHVPFAAGGVLVTGGLVPRGRVLGRSSGRGPVSARATRSLADDMRLAMSGRYAFVRLALSAALGVLAATGPHGLVSPRLVPLLWVAAALGMLGLRRPTRHTGAALVPAIMLGALLAGAPPPPYAATETELGEAFPGERLAFTGVAQGRGSATVLERFAITCCRADASPVSVRLTGTLDVANGSWIEARGTLEESAAGLVLRPATWRRIRAPVDAFVYR